MRIALCQINTTVGDFEGNLRRVIECLEKARDAGAGLAVFPELTLTGYPPRDLLERPSFVAGCRRALDELTRATRAFGEMGVVVGAVSRNTHTGKPLFNEAVLLAGGRSIFTHRKTLLPGYDVFDEERYFEPAPVVAPCSFGGLKIGLTICEDAWNDERYRPGRRYRTNPLEPLVGAGARILLNISASPFSTGKGRVRSEMLCDVARRHRLPVVMVNLVGGNDSLIFDGRSLIVAEDGEPVVQAAAFAEDFVVVEVPAIHRGSAVPANGAGEPVPPVPAPLDEMEEIRRALVLGLRDYVRKCGFSRVVLGLSGGIDSAVTAALAVEALGPGNVLGAWMPGRYTSDLSRREAFRVAENLGIPCKEIPIDGIYGTYLADLAPGLEGLPGDSTEENIQARIRGNILMALSNRFGHLVLSTGNKSEIAVGYCTLYGDMCGGLCVISDLYKTEVYRLAAHLNREREVIPEETIRRAPSAELKPDQRDQDTLPPYELLDAILRLYVDEGLDPEAIAARGLDAATVSDVVRRVDASEYKRQQAAPGLRVSWKAFGTGRRIPIARKIPPGRTPGRPAT